MFRAERRGQEQVLGDTVFCLILVEGDAKRFQERVVVLLVLRVTGCLPIDIDAVELKSPVRSVCHQIIDAFARKGRGA
jgi:hypothetical protein